MGSVAHTKRQLLEFLRAPGTGSGLVWTNQHLIAAKLNIEIKRANDAAVAVAIFDADGPIVDPRLEKNRSGEDGRTPLH